MASASKAASGPISRLTLFSSTSSCVLALAVAGTPPVSATISWILRPASVLPRSARYICMARSMSMPPEASGPVFTVSRPMRTGSACAWATPGSVTLAAAAAAPFTNSRLLCICCLLGCWMDRKTRSGRGRRDHRQQQPGGMVRAKVQRRAAGEGVGRAVARIVVQEGAAAAQLVLEVGQLQPGLLGVDVVLAAHRQ